jgi:hypothetical protein
MFHWLRWVPKEIGIGRYTHHRHVEFVDLPGLVLRRHYVDLVELEGSALADLVEDGFGGGAEGAVLAGEEGDSAGL